MKEHPLLYCTAMVRATLAGRKDVTRRVITEADCWRNGLNRNYIEVSLAHAYPQSDGANVRVPYRNHADHEIPWRDCGVWQVDPRWQAGDLCWGREKVRLIEVDDGSSVVGGVGQNKVRLRYEADGAESDWLPYPDRLAALEVGQCVAYGCYKEAARIWREVVSVRGERLQEISPEDAIREGIEIVEAATLPHYGVPGMPPKFRLYGPLEKLGQLTTDPRWSYQTLYDSLNEKRGYPWASNRLVWRIESREAKR